MKRILYAIMVALVAASLLAPAALAQEDTVLGDDDPFAPEPNVVELENDELEKAVGRQIPKQIPDEPIDEPGGPAPKGATLPKSGGVVVTPSALLLPAAALLLGSGILTYAAIRRRR